MLPPGAEKPCPEPNPSERTRNLCSVVSSRDVSPASGFGVQQAFGGVSLQPRERFVVSVSLPFLEPRASQGLEPAAGGPERWPSVQKTAHA